MSHLQRWALVAVALAVVAFVVLRGGSGDSRGSASAGRDDDGDAGGEDDGRGGIGRREVMAAAVGTIEADVVDAEGAPLSGGRVVLRCLVGDDVRAIEGGVVEIDDDGRLVGPGCRGQVCVDLRHAGFVPSEPWLLTPGRIETLTARPLGAFVGEVVDAGGAAVPAAHVVVSPVADDDPTGVLPFTSSTTLTDADGIFTLSWIERPPCGPCEMATRGCEEPPLPTLDRVRLTVRAAGFGPAERTVEVDAGEPVVVTMPEAAVPIRGTLVDPEGQPYARAYVLARSEARPAEQQRADPVDGVFTLDQLGEGTYTLRALQDGVALQRMEGVAAGSEVDLVGPPQRDLVVEVVDADARPVVGATVDGGPFDRVRTDAQGRVRAAAVAEGSYMLRIRPRRMPAAVHTVEVGGTGADPGLDAATGAQIAWIRTAATSEQ